ncbi:MAG: (Fe-S)-binding protein [Thermoplasmata archaeon]
MKKNFEIYKQRAILLESPSGKAEEWLSKQDKLETTYDYRERYANDEELSKIFSKKQGDESYFINELKGFKKNSKAFVGFMESCTHCGVCIDKCPMFIATGDKNNSPVGRAEIIRKLYKKLDRVRPELEVDLKKIYTYYYQCTECRRCSIFCPQGIDQSEITRTVRDILTGMGIQPEYVVNTLAQMYRVGNNMGLNQKAIANAVHFMEDELKENTGKEIPIMLDKPKAEILFLPSSTDITVNLDTGEGYIKFLYNQKIDYTISSKITEIANFGLFSSERYLKDMADIIVKEAIAKNVKAVVWGECGHGWRAGNSYTRYELAKHGIQTYHIHQLAAKAISRGQVKLDKNKNDDLYNYHDPCNYARGGNLVNEPREILKAVVRETVESKYNKAETLCCGAGAGLLSDERDWNDFRAWAGWPSVYYAWKTGAHYMISPCAIDKAQYPFVINYHKVDKDIQMKGLMDLFGYAIEL